MPATTYQIPKSSRNFVLDVYAKLNSKPGAELKANKIIVFANRNHVTVMEVERSLAHAVSHGWVEKTRNGLLRLTDSGFQEMPHSA